MSKFNGVYIPSIDAKDIYLANTQSPKPSGYTIVDKNNNPLLNKYINTLDYSLELIKLRQIYSRVYRKKSGFSFLINDKEYCDKVINLTFKYSCKSWNKYASIYVRYGYNNYDIQIEDGVFLVDGMVVAIKLDSKVENPVSNNMLAPYFMYDEKECVYKRTEKKLETLKNVSELREHIYINGFICNGKKYVRYKRSSGSSRVGKCLFIDEKLYSSIHAWETCGIRTRKDRPIDLAAYESYISLTLSSIIGTVQISKENILVIDDHMSVFKDEVMEIYDVDGELKTKKITKNIENNIWDGQSIGDVSIFGKYKRYGMILLRNRFFKTACLNCNLQQWFADNNIKDVRQLNGFTYAKDISDIKLITTPSNIKYLKFGTLETWLENLDSTFGIVKHEKPQRFYNGEMVQMHYQLLNSLLLTRKDVAELLRPETDHMKLMKEDVSVFREYLKIRDYNFSPSPLYSQNEIVFNLLGLNYRFYDTGMCRRFTHKLFKSYKNRLKKGRLLIDGTYATLFSNPMEMLKMAIGTFDGKSSIPNKHVVTSFYNEGEEIVGSRSPHISFSNVWLNTVIHNDEMDKYFNITREIIFINNINENVFNQLSGADCDGDTVLITNNKIIVEAAKRTNGRYLIPTDAVSATKVKRYYTNDEKADLDIKTSVNLIGEIVNMSQLLNSLYWHLWYAGDADNITDDIYADICKLDIMSRIEIDSAKKEFAINNSVELRKLRDKYKPIFDSIGGIPKFFKELAILKNYKPNKNYVAYNTAMDYLQTEIRKQSWGIYKYSSPALNIVDIINYNEYNCRKVNYKQIRAIVDLISIYRAEVASIYNSKYMNRTQKQEQANIKRKELIDILSGISVKMDTIYKLMLIADDKKNNSISRSIINFLFESSNLAFYALLYNSVQPFEYLMRSEDGDITIYGRKYHKNRPIHSEYIA